MRIAPIALALSLALAAAPSHASDGFNPFVSANPDGFSWDGFYLGAHGGYGWFTTTWPNGHSTTDRGELFGGHGGYNHMVGRFLLGAEIDLSSATINEWSRFSDQVSLLTSARVRAGVTHDRYLLFATAGIGAARISQARFTGAKQSETHVGWVAGGGLEVMLTDFLSLRGEYLHYQLPYKTYNLGLGNFRYGGNVDLVRGGLSVHF